METAANLTDLADTTLKEKQVVLESMLGLQPAFRQLVLLDTFDRPTAEASGFTQSSSNSITTRLAENVLTQIHAGNNYIGPVYINDSTSEPLVVMAIPLKILGDFQGSLMAEVDLKFMWDLVDQLQVGETGYTYVVDNNGNLIAFGDTARVLGGENVN